MQCAQNDKGLVRDLRPAFASPWPAPGLKPRLVRTMLPAHAAPAATEAPLIYALDPRDTSAAPSQHAPTRIYALVPRSAATPSQPAPGPMLLSAVAPREETEQEEELPAAAEAEVEPQAAAAVPIQEEAAPRAFADQKEEAEAAQQAAADQKAEEEESARPDAALPQEEPPAAAADAAPEPAQGAQSHEADGMPPASVVAALQADTEESPAPKRPRRDPQGCTVTLVGICDALVAPGRPKVEHLCLRDVPYHPSFDTFGFTEGWARSHHWGMECVKTAQLCRVHRLAAREVLGCLPRTLESICLCHQEFADGDVSRILSTLKFPNLRSLALHDTEGDLSSLLRALPASLERLVIVGTRVDLSVLAQQMQRFKLLRALRIEGRRFYADPAAMDRVLCAISSTSPLSVMVETCTSDGSDGCKRNNTVTSIQARSFWECTRTAAAQ